MWTVRRERQASFMSVSEVSESGVIPVNLYGVRFSGRSAARLARLLWEQKVGGSNPLAPIQNEVMTQTPIAQLDRATDF